MVHWQPICPFPTAYEVACEYRKAAIFQAHRHWQGTTSILRLIACLNEHMLLSYIYDGLHMLYDNGDNECTSEAKETLEGTQTASYKQEHVIKDMLCAVPLTSGLLLVLTSCLWWWWCCWRCIGPSSPLWLLARFCSCGGCCRCPRLLQYI